METLKVAGFRAQMKDIIANNELNIGTTLFVLKDIVSEIETLYEETLQKEYQEFQEKMKQEKENEQIEPKVIVDKDHVITQVKQN